MTIYVRTGDDSYGHVDRVDHQEADDLPELDLLVEEDDGEVDGRHDVGDDISVEGEGIHLAVADEGHHASDHGRDEQSRAQVRSHADVAVAADHGRHEGKHIRTAIAEGQEGDTRDARGDAHLLHHVCQRDAKVFIGRVAKM